MDPMMKINYDYDSGRYTGTDAVFKLLAIIDADNVEQLEHLSGEFRDELVQYLDGYRPEARSTSDRHPSENQVQIAKAWLERNAKM